MTHWKRIKRLWTLLTTDEVFDEHGSRGRRKVVRSASELVAFQLEGWGSYGSRPSTLLVSPLGPGHIVATVLRGEDVRGPGVSMARSRERGAEQSAPHTDARLDRAGSCLHRQDAPLVETVVLTWSISSSACTRSSQGGFIISSSNPSSCTRTANSGSPAPSRENYSAA